MVYSSGEWVEIYEVIVKALLYKIEVTLFINWEHRNIRTPSKTYGTYAEGDLSRTRISNPHKDNYNETGIQINKYIMVTY